MSPLCKADRILYARRERIFRSKPVLSAMGYSRQRADSALRISFSKLNTRDDVDALAEGIALGLKTLAHR